MKKFVTLFRNRAFYNGLEREQYYMIEESINAHNKSMLHKFSGISLVLFTIMSCASIVFGLFPHNRVVYIIGTIISFAFCIIPQYTNLKIKKSYTYMASIWIIFFVSFSLGLAVNPTGIQEKTTLFLIFPLIGPMFFCIPSIIFSFLIIVFEIIYIVILTYLGSQTPFYSINIVNTVVVALVAILVGNSTMNAKANTKYEAIKNLRTDELERLNKSLNNQFGMLKSISTLFHAVYFGDLVENVAYEISNIKEVKDVVSRGTSPKEIMDLLCNNFIEDPDHVRKLQQFVDMDFIQAQFQDRNYISEEYIGKTQGWCRIVCIPVERKDRIVTKVLWCFEKINEQKEREFAAQEQLREALNDAKKADNAKSAFLFNMSHDIRTPMNAILGYANLLEKSEGLNDTQSKYVSGILSSGDQLLGLINNVLETASIESGKMNLNEEILKFHDLEKTIMDVFVPMAEDKNLDLSMSFDIQHDYIYADSVKTNEILFNLVSNSIKYTDEGNVKISISEEAIDDTSSNYIITVKDTGIGISEDFLPHIFESFTREKTVTENKILGTGLGLGITKKLIELMGGSIEVQSTLGNGTSFICSIPYKLSTKEEYEQRNQHENHTDYQMPENMRILLAEDNDLNADIAIEILEEYGINADWAKDGKQCLDMLLDKEPDYYNVILMDMQMPIMNGIDTTKAIRELDNDERSKILIIAMTANAFEQDKKQCLEAGMNGFISKPVEIPKLFKTLAEIVK